MRFVKGAVGGGALRQASATRLKLWATVLAVAVFVLVPLAFDPNAIILDIPAAFYLVKFRLFMYLSAALLVAVLGVVLLGVRPMKLPVLFPALVFLGASTLSTLFSGDVTHSLIGEQNRYDGLLSLCAGVLIFYVIASFVDSWIIVRAVLTAGIISAVVISLYGCIQKFGLDPVLSWNIPWYTGVRAFSTIGNPLFLAAYLTLAVGGTAALYFFAAARWEKVLWLLALSVMGACWSYAHARGAVLGVGVTLPIILWLSHRRMGTVRPLLIPLSVLLAAMIAATALENSVGQKAGGAAGQEVVRTTDDKSLSVMTRLQIWRDTVPVILERPLLGHGPDNFAAPFKRHEGDDLKAATLNGAGIPNTVDKAHNELLQIMATTGLLGLAAYLWILVSYFRNAYRSGCWPIIALSGGVLAYVLQLQTAFSTIATGVTFWFILGVSVAVMRLQEREAAVAPNSRSEGDELQPLRTANSRT